MNPIILAPTTLPDTAPLEYIQAATAANYDGMALRLHPSPGFPFHPVLGNAPLIRDIKAALKSAPKVWEIGSFYLEPDVDVTRFSGELALGAELGAKYAFTIGNDPDWARLVDSFGRFCDEAARHGLSAFLEFVPMRPLGTLQQTLRLFAEAGRRNVAVCVDPMNFTRSGGRPSDVAAIDPELLPYGQLSDGLVYADERGPQPGMRPNVRRLMGEGDVPVASIVAAMPQGIAYSLELPLELSAVRPEAMGRPMSAAAWARYVLACAKAFLAGLPKTLSSAPEVDPCVPGC
jgi:sugar phosphate isomerase/epimerase